MKRGQVVVHMARRSSENEVTLCDLVSPQCFTILSHTDWFDQGRLISLTFVHTDAAFNP